VKIQTKLFLAFLGTGLLLVLCMFLLVQWSFDRGLLEYANKRELARQQSIADVLADYYRRTGDLRSLRHTPQRWHALMEGDLDALSGESNIDVAPKPRHLPPRRPATHPPRTPQAPGQSPVHTPPRPGNNPGTPSASDMTPLILLDVNKTAIFGHYDTKNNTPLLPIKVNDQTVGWLTMAPINRLVSDYDVNFLRDQRVEFIAICLVMVVISALLALPLSYRLKQPIQRLLTATRQLAGGDYQTRIAPASRDELGQLTEHFNNLATTLELNEAARKRWIVDISHELRTPLAIALGELEAMLDGVRPINQQHIDSAYQEIQHLQKLVEDLYQLTNADVGALRYRREALDLVASVKAATLALASQVQDAKLHLDLQLANDTVMVCADELRIHQLVHNLIINSIKYTDQGGTLRISVTKQAGSARLEVSDSYPGVPDAALPQLFDHLFRVESSRNRTTGGAGIGLALCRKIVAAHDGTITAQHASLGGLSIIVTLPLAETC
jgi:two-component system sensor histidine kinase BaeS